MSVAVNSRPAPARSWPLAAASAAVAVVYFAAGRAALTLAFVHPSATPVWPPTGIALAALLLLGYGVWPGILAGAFLVNLVTAGSALSSAGIALGNTLEGLLGAWLVIRFAGGRRPFERPQDVLRFALVAGVASTAVSATIGVLSLALGGFAPWASLPSIWTTWWLGDLGGDLVVAPLLLLWGTKRPAAWDRRRTAEALLLALCVVLAGLAIFAGLFPGGPRNYPIAFLSLPILLWAAFRFSQREAATATFLLSGIATWGALNGLGPFARGSPNESLLLLQAFTAVASVTTLATAAAVWERRVVEEALARTAAIVDSSEDAILAKDLDGTILSWNTGAERLYGYAAQEVVGRNISLLVPAQRPDETPQILERIRRGERVDHFETERVRKDGRTLSVSLTVSPIRAPDGRVVGASAIARDITERRRAVADLTRLQKAVENLELGVTITDMEGRILYSNRAEAQMHGYRPEELVGRHVGIFMPGFWQPAPGQPSQIRSWRRETVNVRRDGTIFPVQLLSDAVTDAQGTSIGIVTVCEEISERKRAEQALRSSEERYRLLFERNLAGVYRATLDGRLLECNDAFARMLGFASREEVLALTTWDLVFDRSDREDCLARLRETGTPTSFELRMRRKDGTGVWVLENGALIDVEGGQRLVEGTLVDISARKLAEERIAFQAYHDSLTGLPNRALLGDRLHMALAQARRSGRGLALMFVDLDHFKTVNDTLGHAVGDALLVEVAGRLRECVREDDTVARVGGDEFVLLLPHVRQADGASRVAEKVLARLAEPLHVEGRQLSMTASVGIALFPQDGQEAPELIESADGAMYVAKDLGRNTYRLCGRTRPPQPPARAALRSALRQAVDRHEMSLVYQPQIDLRSGRVAGIEALLRWHHPALGPVQPAEFVPLAEDMGLMAQLGDWVLREACGCASALRLERLPPVRLAVNVSARQLRLGDLPRRVERVLEETTLPAPQLELEISETTAMQDFDATAPVLRDLAAKGIGISIDGFGVGYWLLSRLSVLPLRRLKIDGSLIARLGQEPRHSATVKAIVQMAHSLGLAVVAEGVETADQVGRLRQLRCDEIQGFVVSEAVPGEALEAVLGQTYRL